MSKEINFFESQIERFVEALRPKEEVRDQLDMGYTFEKNVFELFEIRPSFMEENEKMHSPIAKAQFVKSRQLWKIYWMPGSMKWTSYTPMPEVKTLEEVFEVIAKDEQHCFWG